MGYFFLIEVISNEDEVSREAVPYDFGLTLINLINYHNWLYSDNHMFKLTTFNDMVDALCDIYEDKKKCIPVGSIEFIQRFYGSEEAPINVPESLFDWAGRKILNINNLTEYPFSKSSCFVKSRTKIKSIINGVYRKSELVSKLFNQSIQVSELIENISSEYRCFVMNGELLDVKRYLGSWNDHRPNEDVLKNIIRSYKDSPSAYTLDVCVTEDNETYIIEVHDFFGCGLYGFNDIRYIDMLIISHESRLIK